MTGRRLLECVVAQCHGVEAVAHGYVVDVGAGAALDWHMRFLAAADLSPVALWLTADDPLCLARAATRAAGWAGSFPRGAPEPRVAPVKFREPKAGDAEEEGEPPSRVGDEGNDEEGEADGGAAEGAAARARAASAAVEPPARRVPAAGLRLAWDDDDCVLGPLPHWLAPTRSLQALLPFRVAERALQETLELRRGDALGSLRLLPQAAGSLPWDTGAEAVRLATAAAEARAAFVARTMRGRAAALQDVVVGAVGADAATAAANGGPVLPPQASHTREAPCGSLCPVAWSARRELVPVTDAAAQRLFGVAFRGAVYRCSSAADRDAFVAHPTRYAALLVPRPQQQQPPVRLPPPTGATSGSASTATPCVVCSAVAATRVRLRRSRAVGMRLVLSLR